MVFFVSFFEVSFNQYFNTAPSKFTTSLQLFRERLSCKRGKAYATMSKVIMGSGGFNGYLSELQGVSP